MTKFFQVISLLEGVSYILLLFVAVPIKYMMGEETYVKMLGMPHGLLFVAYIILAYVLKSHFRWDMKTLLKVWSLSILPFGTFFIKKYMTNADN